MRRSIASIMFILCLTGLAFTQSNTGKIKGKITDEENNPVEFATVVVIKNGTIAGGGNTNENGEYSIAPLAPGKYTVRASFAGNSVTKDNITLKANQSLVVDLKINPSVETTRSSKPTKKKPKS